MYRAIVEIDMHGKNVYQSRIAIDAALRRANAGCCRIRIIHGYNSGTVIRDFIEDAYSDHPKVKRIAGGLNRGITELILRDY